MRKFAFLAVALAFASVASATEYVRVVKPIPAETNVTVTAAFGTAAAPVAFRVLGDAGTNATVSVSLVSNTLGYETSTALVASTNVASNAAVTISASGYAQTAYPGDQIAVTIANPRRETGAVVVWAQK
jgi:hypothetical protein